MVMRNLVILFCLLLSTFQGSAQEHPFLSKFEVRESFGSVRVEWVMISGNTCFGIQILRSFNGVDFEEVGEIEGLCGSIEDSVEFNFVDETVVQFATHYYRLELGANGLSSIQDIFVDQVTVSDAIVVYPTGVDFVYVYAAVPSNADVLFTLLDIQGREVQVGVMPNGSKMRIDKGLKPGSIYIYKVDYMDLSFRGKIGYL